MSYAALGFVVTLFYAVVGAVPAARRLRRRPLRRARGAGRRRRLPRARHAARRPAPRATRCWCSAPRSPASATACSIPADFSILNARVGAARLGYAYSAHGIAGSLGYAAAPLFSGGLGALFGWHVALLRRGGHRRADAASCSWRTGTACISKRRRTKRPEGSSGIGRPVHRAGGDVLPVLRHLHRRPLGLQSFSVAAMTVQYGVAAALASSALTAYMVGSAHRHLRRRLHRHAHHAPRPGGGGRAGRQRRSGCW